MLKHHRRKSGSHVVQANFQMCCTGEQIKFSCFFFFFMKRNYLLIDVMKEITDHNLKHDVVGEGHYEENSHLCKLGKQLLGSIPTFDRMRNFR